jgi:hypothetical protein
MIIALSLHGSSAKVNHLAGSLSGNVKDVIHDSRGTIIRQVGGDDHYYNGFSLPLLLSITVQKNPTWQQCYLHVWLKATKGTWIAWMKLYDGQDERRYYPYEEHNKHPGNGENLDNAKEIEILEQIPLDLVNLNFDEKRMHAMMVFIPIGFPKQEVGEVCLTGAKLVCS